MADGPQQKALRASLKALGSVGRDEAAVTLARRYAALLDASAVPASYRPALARLAALVSTKADQAALDKLTDALSAHTVASDLGPKYLAALASLGLTPAARGAITASMPPDEPEPEPAPEPRPEGKADELRDRRRRRADARRADGAG